MWHPTAINHCQTYEACTWSFNWFQLFFQVEYYIGTLADLRITKNNLYIGNMCHMFVWFVLDIPAFMLIKCRKYDLVFCVLKWNEYGYKHTHNGRRQVPSRPQQTQTRSTNHELFRPQAKFLLWLPIHHRKTIPSCHSVIAELCAINSILLQHNVNTPTESEELKLKRLQNQNESNLFLNSTFPIKHIVTHNCEESARD